MATQVRPLMFLLLIFPLFWGCQRGNSDLQNFQKFVQRFEENNRSINEKNDEMNKILQVVIEQYPDSLKYLLTRVDSTLTPDEMDALENMIESEQDVSLKGQLRQILKLRQELNLAQAELERLRQVLPMPTTIQKGQTHYKICMDYLIQNHQLEKEDARKLIEKVGLFEPVIEKFYVWNYYHEGVFGSFVTQGEALLSPMQVRRMSREKIQTQINAAQARRDSAIYIAEQLNLVKSNLETQLIETNQTLKITRGKVDSLKKEQRLIKQGINSLNYYIDTESSLKNAEYLHGGFLRKTKIKALPPDDFFTSLDLRYDNTILLIANNYGLEHFSKVTVYPKSFKIDLDYKFTYNPEKKLMSLIIKRPEKFKQERILIAVK